MESGPMTSSGKRPYSPVLILVFFGILWFSISLISGSIFSGYHLHNDHEIIRIAEDLSTSRGDVLGTMTHWASRDLNLRFRPLYYAHKVMETYAFGTNYVLWSVYIGFLGLFSSFALYLFGMAIGFSSPISVTLSICTFLGVQSSIFWDHAPAETIGSVFMALALLFMARSVYLRTRVNRSLFWVSMVLMSLSKESFIVLLPAIVLWKISLEKARYGLGWYQATKSNLSVVTGIGTLILIELLCISYFVAGNLGYAGFQGFNLIPFIVAGTSLLKVGFIGVVASIFIVTIAFCKPVPEHRYWGKIGPPLLLSAVIALPQVLLYAKSGFVGQRYYIPAVLGTSLIVAHGLAWEEPFEICRKSAMARLRPYVVLGAVTCLSSLVLLMSQAATPFVLSSISELTRKPINPYWTIITREIYLNLLGLGLVVATIPSLLVYWRGAFSTTVWAIVVIVSVCNYRAAFGEAQLYATQGNQTTLALRHIIDTHKEGDQILVVADPALNYEPTFSLISYLNIVGGIGEIYVSARTSNTFFYNDFRKGLIEAFRSRYKDQSIDTINDKETIRTVVVFPEAESGFLEEATSWLDPKDFTYRDIGVVRIYDRK